MHDAQWLCIHSLTQYIHSDYWAWEHYTFENSQICMQICGKNIVEYSLKYTLVIKEINISSDKLTISVP